MQRCRVCRICRVCMPPQHAPSPYPPLGGMGGMGPQMGMGGMMGKGDAPSRALPRLHLYASASRWALLGTGAHVSYVCQVRYGRGRKGKHKCWKQSLEYHSDSMPPSGRGMMGRMINNKTTNNILQTSSN